MCYRDEKEESFHVRHAQSRLHPRLRVAVGTEFKATIKELQLACEHATTNLKAQDDLLGIKNQVPPMYEDEKYRQKHNNNKQGKSDGKQPKHNAEAESPPHKFDHGGRGRGGRGGRGGKFNSRGAYNAATGRDQPSKQFSQPGKQFNQKTVTDTKGGAVKKNVQSNIPKNPPSRQSDCFRCGGRNHKAKDCPSEVGYAMCIWKDGRFVPVNESDKPPSEEYDEEQESEEQDDLNH